HVGARAVGGRDPVESPIGEGLSATRPLSLEPIVERPLGPFPKFALEAALAAKSDERARARSGHDVPCRLDCAALNHFRTLQHESALASAQLAVESLHADDARGMIVAENL